MVEQNTSGPSLGVAPDSTSGPFPQAAAASLAPVAGQVAQAKEHAESGDVSIDLDAAGTLLRRLEQLKDRADQLVRDCAELDTPLKFGDNWVGEIMSRRLRSVAVDENGGVTPVLRTFHQVLSDLESTVRLASGRYEAMDEEGVVALRRAAERMSTLRFDGTGHENGGE